MDATAANNNETEIVIKVEDKASNTEVKNKKTKNKGKAKAKLEKEKKIEDEAKPWEDVSIRTSEIEELYVQGIQVRNGKPHIEVLVNNYFIGAAFPEAEGVTRIDALLKMLNTGKTTKVKEARAIALFISSYEEACKTIDAEKPATPAAIPAPVPTPVVQSAWNAVAVVAATPAPAAVPVVRNPVVDRKTAEKRLSAKVLDSLDEYDYDWYRVLIFTMYQSVENQKQEGDYMLVPVKGNARKRLEYSVEKFMPDFTIVSPDVILKAFEVHVQGVKGNFKGRGYFTMHGHVCSLAKDVWHEDVKNGWTFLRNMYEEDGDYEDWLN